MKAEGRRGDQWDPSCTRGTTVVCAWIDGPQTSGVDVQGVARGAMAAVRTTLDRGLPPHAPRTRVVAALCRGPSVHAAKGGGITWLLGGTMNDLHRRPAPVPARRVSAMRREIAAPGEAREFLKRDSCAYTEILRVLVSRKEVESNSPSLIELHLSLPDGSETIQVILEGAQGLLLRSMARMQVQGSCLDDVRDRGWESARWELSDFEEGVIGCLAWRVSTVSGDVDRGDSRVSLDGRFARRGHAAGSRGSLTIACRLVRGRTTARPSQGNRTCT